MPKILSLDKHERPREKLLTKGRDALSTLELLQVMIGSGVKGADVTQIARRILRLAEAQGGKLEIEQLLRIRGVSAATAAKLVASIELNNRLTYKGPAIERTEDVLALLADIRTKKQEHVVMLTIDGANRLIEKRTIGIGTLNASLVHPREVFVHALLDRAAGVIVAHNHPSGGLEPSDADLLVTARLYDTGKILDIPLLDHIIVTATDYASVGAEAPAA